MITNLAATVAVSLVTNISERVPSYYFDSYNSVTQKSKFIRTTIKQITSFTFNWSGKREVLSDELILSDIEVEMEEQKIWCEKGTNNILGAILIGGQWYKEWNFPTNNITYTNFILMPTNFHFAKPTIITNADTKP